MAKRKSETKPVQLIGNSRIAFDCRWCSADNEPHSAACPCGERYWQVQALGGVPAPKLTGAELLAFFAA